jgi:hypothetical protein
MDSPKIRNILLLMLVLLAALHVAIEVFRPVKVPHPHVHAFARTTVGDWHSVSGKCWGVILNRAVRCPRGHC